MTDVGPDWRTKHETTVKELVASPTKFGHQKIGNFLKIEKIDKNTIELTTKVDTMFKPMSETYEYQNLLARTTDLEKVDEAAALHCSGPRTHNLSLHKKDFKILTNKLRMATTIAQESRELAAVNTPVLTGYTSNHPSPSTTETNVTNLQASVTDLTLKLSTLSRKVLRLKDTPSSSPIHAVTASTSSRHRNSQTSKSSTLTASTKDTRHKHKHDTNNDRGTIWDKNNTLDSRKRSPTDSKPRTSSTQTWEPPNHDTTQPKKPQHRPPPLEDFTSRDINTTDILHWSDKTLSSRERPSARYCERIAQVPVAMTEQNLNYVQFTKEWYDYREEQLRNIDTHIIAQTMTFTNLAGFLQTTSYLELGSSII